MDQELINRLARTVLAKYRLGADFKAALAEAARSYLAQYKGRKFGEVMSAITKATKATEVRG